MEDSLIVIQAWKEINLNKLVIDLEANQVLQIKALKSTSLACRKQLNESTKAYRSKHKDTSNASGMAVFTDSMDLLKQYQDEIDRLTKRSKYSEAAFMDLFKTLQSAPDPVSSLDGLMKQYASSSSVSKIEIEKLKSEIEQYDAEFSTLKNQDIKIQRLEEEIEEYRESIETQVESETYRRVASIQKDADDRIAEMKMLVDSVEKRFEGMNHSVQISDKKVNSLQEQIYAITVESDNQLELLRSELSQSVECYNRSNARNAELEALLASKASVRITTPPPCASPMPDDTSTDNEAVDVHLVDTLQNELILKDKELLEVRNNYDAKLHGVNELLKQEKDSCAAMRFELRARPLQSEMLELQHEIGVLKSIVFSVDNPDVEESNGEGKATLETMLANKVKSLEKELTSNRIRIWSLEEEAGKLNACIGLLQKEITEKEELIGKLKRSYDSSSSAKAASNSITDLEKLLTGTEAEYSPVASVSPQGVHGSAIKNDLSVVLQSQRDHYRERLEESNNKVNVLQRNLDHMKSMKEKLEKDNVELYSKMKYVSSYKNGGVGDVENHSYASEYENTLNPFSEFASQERQRKLQELSVLDRFLFSATVTCMSTSLGRSLLIGYAFVMHVLVLAIVYYNAHHRVVV